LTKSLLDTIVAWTLPSEPREGLSLTAIRGLGTSLGQVVARVTVVDNVLGLAEEVGQKLPKPPQAQLAAGAAAFAATGNPNPTGRGAVLLGEQARLFEFGGDLFERQNLTITDLRSGEIARIPIYGDVPGRVLAATHRLTSATAVVLDRVPHERHRPYGDHHGDPREHVRLLLLDLGSGVATELASLPWLARFDQHALLTLPCGDTVLVASSSATQRHLVVRLTLVSDRHGHWDLRVLATAEGHGAMIGPPVSSIDGVSVPVRVRGRAWTVTGYRLPTSGHHPGHGLDDCF